MKWGAEPAADGRWRFQLWAPALDRLTLELASREAVAMEGVGGGWFAVETGARAGDRYRFRLPDGLAVPDPASRAQAGSVHGWSILVDHAAFRRRADWPGRPWEEAAICELHAGLHGGFAGVAGVLPRLAEVGASAVELMPVADFAGTRNWGYDGVLPYAPASAYGTPDELKALVDRAHRLGLMVFLDVVYNHFGPDGNYLAAYAPDFFHPEVETPWGAAIAFELEPVRRFFIDNALMWLNEYRFDGVRLDAVHAIGDPSFLDFLAEEVRSKVEPGRHVHLILENEHNDAGRLRGDFTAQWNDDFHNAAHVLLTGETSGYYRDFADDPAGLLARCLGEGFAYQGQIAPSLGRPRGTPSGDLPPTSFVAFLHNHDQIGNRAEGERLTLLTHPERLKAATALLLLGPQIPLFFTGDEVGSRSPFLFFTDFGGDLGEAVRQGRRAEFAAFAGFEADAAPDPEHPDTFEASRPAAPDDAGDWFGFYRDLLALRRREIVPRLAGARALDAEKAGESGILARWRMGDGAKLTIFADLGEGGERPSATGSEPLFALPDGRFSAWLEAP